LEKIQEAMEGYIAVLLEHGDPLPQDVLSARIPVEVAA
jgi:predicted RNase H-like HicB family nuclease